MRQYLNTRVTQPLYALPVEWPIHCRTNADYREELLFQDGSNPLNIEGAVFQIDVRRDPGSAILQSFGMASSSGDEGLFISDDIGSLQLVFLQSTIMSIFTNVYPDCTNLHYDMHVTLSDSSQEVWLTGHFNIAQGVTYG